MQDEVTLYRDKATSFVQVLIDAAIEAERLLSLGITVLVTSQAPEGLMRWALPYLMSTPGPAIAPAARSVAPK